MTKTYSEMEKAPTFEERFRYLQLKGEVGKSTFGFDRHLNQMFYTSREWKAVRDVVILRDNGRDLAFPGREIHDRIYIHHMNPMTPEDIENGNPDILNPEYLVSVTHTTHNAIHFGDERLLLKPIVERKPGDTTLW